MTGSTLSTTLAQQLIVARNGGPAIDPASQRNWLNAELAYAVQSAVVAEIGPVGAFKTARNPDQPTIMAPIFKKDVFNSPARFEPDRFGLIGIELEIGFVVLKNLPPLNAPDFRDRARFCVAPAAVIEVVDTRLTDIPNASPMLKLADNQLNGGLVVGDTLRDWQGADFTSVTATLRFDDDLVLDGSCEVPGGDAFESFCALAELVGGHCGGLKAGHVVITGSLNGMPFVPQGTRVEGTITGIGEVSAQF